ncbi:MAG: metallophosphoesterase [Termitinemataceae bacterium]|nr:MAG: metallophosphoesterase [Termitinemataceae bacterium]
MHKIITAAISVFCALFFLNCTTSQKLLIVQDYQIGTAKIKQDTVIKIILITDLHSEVYEHEDQPIINKINAVNPDLIMLAGDIVDDKTPIAGAALFLSLIKDIAPIYYVTGNHEYYSNKIPQIIEMLQSFGVHILSDNFVQIQINGNDIILAGIEDPAIKKYYNKSYTTENIKTMLAGISTLTDSKYAILLIHRPEISLTYKNNFDLLLSGHAHGGQIRTKVFKNGLYAPGQGFFPKYTGGLYNLDDDNQAATLIVSAGLSTKRPRFSRKGNPPEIVLIRIYGF